MSRRGDGLDALRRLYKPQGISAAELRVVAQRLREVNANQEEDLSAGWRLHHIIAEFVDEETVNGEC